MNNEIRQLHLLNLKPSRNSNHNSNTNILENSDNEMSRGDNIVKS